MDEGARGEIRFPFPSARVFPHDVTLSGGQPVKPSQMIHAEVIEADLARINTNRAAYVEQSRPRQIANTGDPHAGKRLSRGPHEQADGRREKHEQGSSSDSLESRPYGAPVSQTGRQASGTEALIAANTVPRRKRFIDASPGVTAVADLDQENVGAAEPLPRLGPVQWAAFEAISASFSDQPAGAPDGLEPLAIAAGENDVQVLEAGLVVQIRPQP